MHDANEVVLTANEYDIVQRLLRKENAPQIARETQRSVHTVRTTIRGIYGKLGVHSVPQLSEALACGDLIIRVKEPVERTFGLASALRVLESESARSKGSIWPVKLHRAEIDALRDAGYAYNLLAAAGSNPSSLIERVESLVAEAETQRPRVAAAIAAALGAQDHLNGLMRDPSQIETLGAVCADNPFPLKQRARSELIDSFRTAYAAGSLARSRPDTRT
jgi:DNA-binding CsgD family transcriptional regulator